MQVLGVLSLCFWTSVIMCWNLTHSGLMMSHGISDTFRQVMVRYRGITWTNNNLLSVEPLGTKFFEIWSKIW